MNLPIAPPYEPMEMTQVDRVPDGPQWEYEPKWDGFRALVFRDGDEIEIQSKSGQPLARYFPEVVERLAALAPRKFVLDGELMVEIGDELSFDALLARIHPAASRVERLARETPARLVVFDLLVNERGEDLTGKTLDERRAALETFAERYFKGGNPALSPATRERGVVDGWFAHVGNALDGVVAKRRDLPYASGTRAAAVKIKHMRTADCVVGGYRLNKEKDGVGSLLLGLYDEFGKLNHVGFTSGFKTRDRSPLLKQLRQLEKPPGFTGSAPGGPSRWRQSEEPWVPLDPKLVVEVQYDHVTANRFRHGTKLLRFRPDKAPRQCTMEQLRVDEAATPLTLLRKRKGK
ncbi:MAG TPA: ATP-dependent DNA ligase [Candidatus Aquilonibacter sp.]|nr:ATP-dependent DNA ligase [Candidatus Aquilonibacter sp.]